MDESNLDVFGIVGSMVGGAYQVQSVVAEGGFAVVYRAEHTGFSAPVALKCLKLPQKLDAERQASFLRQFRAEGELLFQLSSSIPAVVRPLHIDALTTPDGTFVPFMVLEWLDGETLDGYVRQRREEGRPPLSLKKLVRLLTPVARALERAHHFRGPRGVVSIVHRDLKPENIFVADVAGDEVVKILDFGVASAQSVASQVAGHNTESAAPGFLTPAYAAPEQWLPKRYGQTGPWTDVFGLALTLVEAMKGSAVLTGDVQSMMAAALDKQKRPTPRHHGVEVPDAVERIFERALALDPRDRPADVGVFWDELSTALGLKIEDRHRDRRTEAGLVPREERIEAAMSTPPRTSGAPRSALALDATADLPSSAKVRVAARVNPDSSGALRVAPDLESSTRIAAASSPELGSASRVAVARVALVPRSSPLPREEPRSAPPPRLDLGLPAELEIEPPSRVEIDLQTSPRDEPRRIQTGRHAPYFPVASAPAHEPPLWPRLALGAGLIVAAIVLALADRALAGSGGLPLPVSPTLIGAILVLAGIGIIVHRLLSGERA